MCKINSLKDFLEKDFYANFFSTITVVCLIGNNLIDNNSLFLFNKLLVCFSSINIIFLFYRRNTQNLMLPFFIITILLFNPVYPIITICWGIINNATALLFLLFILINNKFKGTIKTILTMFFLSLFVLPMPYKKITIQEFLDSSTFSYTKPQAKRAVEKVNKQNKKYFFAFIIEKVIAKSSKNTTYDDKIKFDFSNKYELQN